MKTKIFDKKLNLNKQTIADLKDGQMNKIKGGVNTKDRTLCATRCISGCETITCCDYTVCICP
jgi:hypothetical protein